jgi:hypothetical protein
VGYQDREVVVLPDGRLVAFEAPPAARDEQEDTDPPSATWRAAILDTGGKAWHMLPPSEIATGRITGGDLAWTAAGGRIVNGDPRTLPATKLAGIHLGTAPLGGTLDVAARRWERLPDLPGTPHEYRSAPKGQPQPQLGWTTRDLLRTSGEGHTLAYGWAYDSRQGMWAEVTPIPGDRDGLSDLTGIWAGDRLLLWANGKVKATPDRTGYRIVRTHAGWSWQPA